MANRYYPVGDKELASVTTITGLADKSDALIPWAVNCAIDYIDDKLHNIENGTGRLILDDMQDARTEWRTVRDEAGDIGTQVHDALEDYLKGETSFDLEGQAFDLLTAAIGQLEQLGPYTVLATEQKVINKDEWYAGRFDALLEVDGETWLIDFKTGGAFYPEWGMQLAAYAEAWNLQVCHYECPDPLGVVELECNDCAQDKKRIDRIKVLRLDKKTLKAHWKEYGGEKDTLTRDNYLTAFYGLRDAFYTLKAKKAVKQAWLGR
jgi:hypothetical protein